jgi:hypothetical protein
MPHGPLASTKPGADVNIVEITASETADLLIEYTRADTESCKTVDKQQVFPS